MPDRNAGALAWPGHASEFRNLPSRVPGERSETRDPGAIRRTVSAASRRVALGPGSRSRAIACLIENAGALAWPGHASELRNPPSRAPGERLRETRDPGATRRASRQFAPRESETRRNGIQCERHMRRTLPLPISGEGWGEGGTDTMRVFHASRACPTCANQAAPRGEPGARVRREAME